MVVMPTNLAASYDIDVVWFGVFSSPMRRVGMRYLEKGDMTMLVLFCQYRSTALPIA